MLRVLTLSTLFPDVTRPNFGVFVARQTQALAERPQVEVQVVAPVGLPPFPLSTNRRYRDLARLAATETWDGLSVLRPRFVNLPGTGGRFHARMLAWALGARLARLRETFPFDVIDAEFFFPDGPAAVAIGRRLGIPVSIKARGADIQFWGRQPATAAQVQAAGRGADGLLAVSEALARDMAAIGIPHDRIRVHRTGIDRTRFHPRVAAVAPQSIGLSGPLVVSLGALIARKGHAVVIDAVARLPGVSLAIVGEGPDRALLQARIRALGIADRVRLIGALPHDQLPPLLAGAAVMALASASEGLANAWVEALACGTPIVITDAGGARELVDRDAAGRVVARDAGAFAAAIAELIAHPPDPRAVAATTDRFSWERNAEELEAHLRALVASGPRAGRPT